MFFFVQPTSAPRIARRRRRSRQSGRRYAPGQTRLSSLRIAGDSAAQCKLFGQGSRHVVARRHSLHNAGRTVSFEFLQC